MPTVHRIQKLVWVWVLKILQKKIHISNQQPYAVNSDQIPFLINMGNPEVIRLALILFD
jgi:hypothetical protein